MRRIIVVLMMTIANFLAIAGHCDQYSRTVVNQREVYFNQYYPPEYNAVLGWIGKSYVYDVGQDIIGCYAKIYIHPGDSVILNYKDTVARPGEYIDTVHYCYLDYSWIYIGHFYVSYLPDTMETYYKYKFDKHFIDSMALVQGFIRDSLASLPPSIYPDPVGDVLKLQCFTTVPDPFDFQAYDLEGRCVLLSRVAFTAQYQTQTIDVTGIPAGTYVTKYFMNGKEQRRQIVKM